MSSSDELGSASDLSFRGRQRKSSFFLVLATGLLLFAAVVGVAFLMLRPTTLRIAVGPSGSDDQQLVQAMAQTFARDGGAVRLAVVTTAGPVDSIAALAAGNADLAVARTDEEMPEGSMSVAIMRKNVVVLWAPTGPARRAVRKDSKSKVKAIEDLPGHKVGVVGRTQVNVTLFRVILKESGVDPDKVQVAQFGADQINEMVRDTSVDAFMTVAPLDSKMTIDAIVATARLRGEPTFLPIDVSEAIAAHHPLYESEEIPGSAFTSSPARPDDTVETVGVQSSDRRAEMAVGDHGCDARAADFCGKAVARQGNSGRGKDREARHRQGCRSPCASRRRRLYRRHRADLHGQIQRLHLGCGVAAFGVRVDHRRRASLRQARRTQAEYPSPRKAGGRDLAGSQDRYGRRAGRHATRGRRYPARNPRIYDDGAIEEADLAAYSLVLSQFHHAVADRRAALGGAPVSLSRMRAG
jgi:TRAP-type uncharacterized transport system substrate-binding protein